ncbi:hypothetical protein AA0312_0150 [Acetobacter tropicalis NRIC 0312]|uniref:Uncharacterized protein n=1 Tax=Acetobacter tropicalis TaxID=104102 RepID=A0A511FM72_9PROT|nr:hypothetical protein ATR1_075c0142 [Acetobacter tropicalis]GBR66873.1 hypothetical protein AA0312_0150 [Acetobacter tropicalis NRIC 0312]GEL49068.1 hypothetical protein ATR01nite_01430 [Acetobacter tropicalis]
MAPAVFIITAFASATAGACAGGCGKSLRFGAEAGKCLCGDQQPCEGTPERDHGGRCQPLEPVGSTEKDNKADK